MLSADENTLYTLNPRAGTVSAVSAATGKISQTYKIGANLHGLDISDDGRALFISSVTENKLVALDLRTEAQRSLMLSPDPYHLNAIRGTRKVYISSRSAPIVWVVDQKTLKLIDTIKLPAGEGHQIATVKWAAQ